MAKNLSSDDRRQAARDKARQIAQAQAKREKTAKTVLYSGIGLIVLAVIVVIVVLLVQAARPAPGPSAYSDDSLTLVKGDGGVKAVGAKDGKDVPEGLTPYADSGIAQDAPVVKVYLDLQCPSCKGFEEANGGTLEKLVKDGTIAVQYQPVAILDQASGGNKYSSRAANLTACVADSGQGDKFFPYLKAMFAGQPEENTNGLDDAAMLANAAKGGIDVNAKIHEDSSKTVADCAKDQTFGKYVENSTQAALKDGLQGTPRVEINGKDVDSQVWSDPNAFATEVLKAAGKIKS